jgi:ketosteroid isomerase-like protein
MSHHEHPNAMIARAMGDAMARGDFEKAGSYVADDVEWHEIGRKEPRHGTAELRAAGAETADSTFSVKTHDVVANDDHTIALGEATVTRGGKTITYRTAEIYHIKDGKVVERWAFSDDTQRILDFFA